jgi:hypothetical protein
VSGPGRGERAAPRGGWLGTPRPRAMAAMAELRPCAKAGPPRGRASRARRGRGRRARAGTGCWDAGTASPGRRAMAMSADGRTGPRRAAREGGKGARAGRTAPWPGSGGRGVERGGGGAYRAGGGGGRERAAVSASCRGARASGREGGDFGEGGGVSGGTHGQGGVAATVSNRSRAGRGRGSGWAALAGPRGAHNGEGRRGRSVGP